jgi:hypothetical protein
LQGFFACGRSSDRHDQKSYDTDERLCRRIPFLLPRLLALAAHSLDAAAGPSVPEVPMVLLIWLTLAQPVLHSEPKGER